MSPVKDLSNGRVFTTKVIMAASLIACTAIGYYAAFKMDAIHDAAIASENNKILAQAPKPKEVKGVLDLNVLNYELVELKRKVSGSDGKGGLQHQVTVLTAKVDSQAARIKDLEEHALQAALKK